MFERTLLSDANKDQSAYLLDMLNPRCVSDVMSSTAVLGTLPMPQGGSKMTDRFFPLARSSSTSTQSPLDTTVAKREEAIRSFYQTVSMPIPNEASSSEPLFSGQQYKIFKAADHEGTLPRDYARVLQLVCDVTGILSSVIEAATYKVELRMAKLEAGDKQVHLPSSQLPVEGIESRMFGKLRQKGGATPWAKEIIPQARTAKPEKENAVLVPKFHG